MNCAAGMVGTEMVKELGFFPPDKLESVEYTGRTVAALLQNFLGDPRTSAARRHSGKTLAVWELAVEFGVRDVDGKQPTNPEQAGEMDLLIGGNRGIDNTPTSTDGHSDKNDRGPRSKL